MAWRYSEERGRLAKERIGFVTSVAAEIHRGYFGRQTNRPDYQAAMNRIKNFNRSEIEKELYKILNGMSKKGTVSFDHKLRDEIKSRYLQRLLSGV